MSIQSFVKFAIVGVLSCAVGCVTEDDSALEIEDETLSGEATGEVEQHGVILCVVENVTFPFGNIYYHHTTAARSCVVHKVDFNRAYADFGVGQWATASFPQFTGAFNLQKIADCHDSKVRVKRTDPTGATYIAERTAEARVVDGQIVSCIARYSPSQCQSWPYDEQTFTARPLVRGDEDAPLDGATVRHDAKKGNDC